MGPIESIAAIALEGGKDVSQQANWNPLPRADWDRRQKVEALVRAIRELGFHWVNLAGGLTRAGVTPDEWLPEAIRLLGPIANLQGGGLGAVPAMVSAILDIDEGLASSIRQTLPRQMLQDAADHVVASTPEIRERRRKLLI